MVKLKKKIPQHKVKVLRKKKPIVFTGKHKKILDDLDELDDLGDEVLDDEGLEDITGSVTTDVTERLGSYGKWILGIIIVIVILIIVVFVYKMSTKMNLSLIVVNIYIIQSV